MSSGVIREKDSSSAYRTITPVESLTPPGNEPEMSATSPGVMPASGA